MTLRRSLLVLFVLTLVAAGCGGGDDTQPDAGAGEGAATEGAATETAPTEGAATEGSSDTAEASGEPLVVGYAATLTGFSANADTAGLLGVETMVEQLNNEGGIDGHPVELVVKDMKSDPSLGGTVTQELLDEGAAVILGPPFPGQAAGVIQTAAKQDVPVLSVTSTGPEFTEVGGSPAFLAAFGDNAQAAAMAEYALEQGHKKSFIMTSPDLNYTSKNAEWFAEAFEEGGGKNLGSETFKVEQGDFSAQVTKIANLDPQPDVIYASMFMPDVGTFVRQARQEGIDAAIYGGDGFDNQAFVDFAGKAAENVAFSTHGYAETSQEVADFTDQATEHNNGKAPDNIGLTALGGDAMLIIKAAVENAGSIEPQAIAEGIGQISDLAVVTGDVSYEEGNGVPTKTVTVGAVEDGKIVFKDAFIPSFIPEPK